MDNSVCELPCWNNIVPGQTTSAEFLKIVKGLSSVDQGSIVDVGSPWNSFDNSIYFSVGRDIDVEASLLNDRIVLIGFHGSLSVTMSQLVERIGDPEYVLTLGGRALGDRYVILLYPELGVEYMSYIESGEMAIQPSNEISSLQLFDPQYFEEILDAGMFSNGFYNAQQTHEIIYQWVGYGDLETLYPLRRPE